MQTKKNIFSFGEDDEKFISSIQPLPNQAVERSAFTAKEFDPDTFLSGRRHLGLERMKAELNTHLKSLKSELVELINKDYQDFINLSTNLKGVDKDISQLKQPLANMESNIKDVRGHFQNIINSLELQLNNRAQLGDKKSILKLLLNIHNSVTKVENLLGINTDISKNNFDRIENDDRAIIDENLGKQIERVAIEYNQMQHLVRRGKDLAFVTENEWRITRIKDTIEQKLSKALSAALSQIRLGEVTKATKQSLTQCLRTYALIDQTQIAEKLIREEFVRPILKKWITQKSIDTNRQNDSNHPLTTMYNKILNFASTDLKPILDITQKTLTGSNYEILVNSLWIEVTDRINKECKSIFAAGQTDVFHKNYTATVAFITGLEGICYSKRSILYLRQHPSYHEFMKKWQLLVYFQLRFREIVKVVESTLTNPKESLTRQSDNKSDGVTFLASQAVLSAIHQCWSEHIFLYGLSHRFWKLTLQLIKRYNNWISDTFIKTEGYKVTDKDVETLNQDIDHFTAKIKTTLNKEIIPKLPSNVQDLPLLEESIDDLLKGLKITASSLNTK